MPIAARIASSLRVVICSLAAGALVVVGATAATAAPAAVKVNPAEYVTYQQEPVYITYSFSSPSGNLRCTISQFEDSAPWGCEARKHAWKQPVFRDVYDRPCAAPKRSDPGSLVASHPGARFACGIYRPEKGRVLPVGRSITVNDVTCVSSRTSGRETMSCSTTESKTSFRMSRTTLSYTRTRR